MKIPLKKSWSLFLVPFTAISWAMKTKPHENHVKMAPWKNHENSILSILKIHGCFIVMKNLLIVWHEKNMNFNRIMVLSWPWKAPKTMANKAMKFPLFRPWICHYFTIIKIHFKIPLKSNEFFMAFSHGWIFIVSISI